MDNDDDEDVTFENSVLGQHIKEVGFENLGLEPTSYDKVPEGSFSEGKTWQEDTDQPRQQLPASNIEMTGAGPSEASRSAAAAVWGAIYRSRLLEEEDAALLQHMHPDWVASQPGPDRLLTTVGTYISRFCLTTAAVSSLWWWNLLPSSYFATSPLTDQVACLFTMAALGVPSLINMVQRSWESLQHSTDVQKVNQVIVVIHELKKIMKKAVRLVQETELVARGFTIARFLSAAEKYEQQNKRDVKQRQCPRLRLLLFHTARNLVITVKNMTHISLQEHPLDHSVGDTWNYLAKVPLEEYGACVTSQDDDELKNLTDDYSITAVKAMVHLYNLHCSELLQRLALLAVWTPQGLQVVLKTVQDLQPVLEKQSRELQQSVSFHQDMVLEQPDTQPSRQPRSSSQLAGLYTAVHSLDLHLQAALRRGRELTKKLETLQEADAAVSSVRQQLTAELTSIKVDVEACRECWEEAQALLDRAAGTQPPADPVSPSHLDVNKANPILPEVKPIPLFEGSGPVIQDEVFEAYTDPTEVEDVSWDAEQLLTDEERALKKKQKTEAVRMLKELRTVISVRAQDREERERRALERGRHRGAEQAHMGNGGDGASYGGASRDNAVSETVQQHADKNSLSPIQSFSKSNDNTDGLLSEKNLNSSQNIMDYQEEGQGNSNMADTDTTNRDNSRPTLFMDRGEGAISSASESSEDEESLPRESEAITKRRDELVAKVQRMSGMPFAMSGGVAAMAAARSQALGLQEQTIGDLESDEEGVTG